MAVVLTADERAALEAAVRRARLVREWRRYRALLMLAEGRPPQEIAELLLVSLASIYNWRDDWRKHGIAGLHESVHPGLLPRLDPAGMIWLDTLLSRDPADFGYPGPGWTVATLHAEAQKAGYSLSTYTLRRAIWRLGWKWKGTGFAPSKQRADTPT